jgi:hypothetical protein
MIMAMLTAGPIVCIALTLASWRAVSGARFERDLRRHDSVREPEAAPVSPLALAQALWITRLSVAGNQARAPGADPTRRST